MSYYDYDDGGDDFDDEFGEGAGGKYGMERDAMSRMNIVDEEEETRWKDPTEKFLYEVGEYYDGVVPESVRKSETKAKKGNLLTALQNLSPLFLYEFLNPKGIVLGYLAHLDTRGRRTSEERIQNIAKLSSMYSTIITDLELIRYMKIVEKYLEIRETPHERRREEGEEEEGEEW